MTIYRVAAFSVDGKGGNPAGVMLLDAPETATNMQRIAAEVGYSETVFAVPVDRAKMTWRTRYFSPETEVAFCGHATIALGAVLGRHVAPGAFKLDLNETSITVAADLSPAGMSITLWSPPTSSRDATAKERDGALDLLGLSRTDLDLRLPPAHIHGGADHIVLALKDRAVLAAMDYDLNAGRAFMHRHNLVTIMLVHIENDSVFNARNAFASGGVLEDPATGAAAAAFAGYLRDINWPHGGHLTIHQGYDMNTPCEIHVELTNVTGASVKISGTARTIDGEV